MYVIVVAQASKHLRLTNVEIMLGHRLQRWSNIISTLGGWPMFADDMIRELTLINLMM